MSVQGEVGGRVERDQAEPQQREASEGNGEDNVVSTLPATSGFDAWSKDEKGGEGKPFCSRCGFIRAAGQNPRFLIDPFSLYIFAITRG